MIVIYLIEKVFLDFVVFIQLVLVILNNYSRRIKRFRMHIYHISAQFSTSRYATTVNVIK